MTHNLVFFWKKKQYRITSILAALVAGNVDLTRLMDPHDDANQFCMSALDLSRSRSRGASLLVT